MSPYLVIADQVGGGENIDMLSKPLANSAFCYDALRYSQQLQKIKGQW